MIQLIQQGGWFMIPLGFCSVVGLAVLLDRMLYLRNASREIAVLLPQLDALIEQEDIDGIKTFCDGNPGLLSSIFRAGVRKYEQIREEPNLDFVQQEINKIMEDASLANTVDLERRLPLLSSVGNVAPLFGFAGTVTGMIRAFERIASTANPNAQIVAGGIQEALVTTASGLIIAIPAVLGYNFLTSRIDALGTRTEESANSLVDMLVMSLVTGRQGAAGAGTQAGGGTRDAR